MLFTIGHKVIFLLWPAFEIIYIMTVAILKFLKKQHKKVILGNVQLVKLLSSFDTHFSLPAVYDASQDKAINW